MFLFHVSNALHRGNIECKEPIEVVSYKIGVCKVSAKGKDCTTNFQKLGFNGTTSVVLCKPRTGRMHQIRVHLQFLGKFTLFLLCSEFKSQTVFIFEKNICQLCQTVWPILLFSRFFELLFKLFKHNYCILYLNSKMQSSNCNL